MDITQVRVFPVDEQNLKAFVSVIFDGCFVVSDIKIIEGDHGLFISMPSKKRRDGTFRDIAHPLNNETRKRMERQIIAEYRQVVTQSGGELTTPLRELGEVHEGQPASEATSAASHERSETEDRNVS